MALEDIVPKPRVTLAEVLQKYKEKGYLYEFHIFCPINIIQPYFISSVQLDHYISEEIEWMNWWIDTQCPK